MKLFILTRTDNVRYDEFDSFVVRAETEQQAREIATAADFSWPKVDERWFALTKCEELTADGPAEVIVGSFNAG